MSPWRYCLAPQTNVDETCCLLRTGELCLSSSHGSFFPPLNCILTSFCSCLASQVRVNFLHLFLFCSTLLSRRDELSRNKWHMINHVLFSLTACVKWRSAVPQEGFFFSLQNVFSVLFLFFYICVFLWAWHSCPFCSFHQGFRFGFFSYLCGAHQIHRATGKWVGEGFKQHSPPPKQ